MKCPYCDKDLEEGADFCDNCGRNFDKQNENTSKDYNIQKSDDKKDLEKADDSYPKDTLFDDVPERETRDYFFKKPKFLLIVLGIIAILIITSTLYLSTIDDRSDREKLIGKWEANVSLSDEYSSDIEATFVFYRNGSLKRTFMTEYKEDSKETKWFEYELKPNEKELDTRRYSFTFDGDRLILDEGDVVLDRASAEETMSLKILRTLDKFWWLFLIIDLLLMAIPARKIIKNR